MLRLRLIFGLTLVVVGLVFTIPIYARSIEGDCKVTLINENATWIDILDALGVRDSWPVEDGRITFSAQGGELPMGDYIAQWDDGTSEWFTMPDCDNAIWDPEPDPTDPPEETPGPTDPPDEEPLPEEQVNETHQTLHYRVWFYVYD